MRRELASRLYPKKIALFETLNHNAEFNVFVHQFFEGAVELRAENPYAERLQLYMHLSSAVLGGRAIDYLEFGVWRGWTLSHWCEINGDRNSRFIGFDSFEGLPEAWNTKVKGMFDLQGKPPTLKDPRVQLVKGLFQDTLYGFLRSFEQRNPMVVHMDCDLYSSTLFCLAAIDRHLEKGSVIIFDEFYDVNHEFLAFKEYLAAFYRKAKGLAYTSRYAQAAFMLG